LKSLLILQLFISISFSQRIQLFTKTDDIFTSANRFSLKNRKVVFWEDNLVLMTVPVKNLVEVRYSEKSHSYIGTPCIYLGSITLAATAALAVAGHLETANLSDQELLLGVGGGVATYYFGKLLKLLGGRFGNDIVYENFDRLDRSTKNLILESISLDMQKKEKQSQFMYGPEGKKRELKLSWEGKKPWKKKYKPKRKIIRFSFF
tara:strand:- start:6537 stop:7151 length:615 start_codon:yes stop_codon:yes gene_type:complete